MAIDVMSLTDTDLETHADLVKVGVVQALQAEDALRFTLQEADEWCATHTVKIRRKSWWRTMTRRWADETISDGRLYYVVVKDVQPS